MAIVASYVAHSPTMKPCRVRHVLDKHIMCCFKKFIMCQHVVFMLV